MTDAAAAEAAERVLAAAQQGARPHDILQIPHDASVSAAKTSFKHLAKLLHPDKQAFRNEQAEEAFVHARCAPQRVASVHALTNPANDVRTT